MIRQLFFAFLNNLNEKYPNQATYIARTLNNRLAAEWLKKIKPEASFEIIAPSVLQTDQAIDYIYNGDLVSLENWLEKGYDSNASVGRLVNLVRAAITSRSLDALKLLKKYGANLHGKVISPVFGTLSYLELAKFLKDNYSTNDRAQLEQQKQQMDKVIEYAEQQSIK
jgi:hypothetical protein